jgi:hypothetical protein
VTRNKESIRLIRLHGRRPSNGAPDTTRCGEAVSRLGAAGALRCKTPEPPKLVGSPGGDTEVQTENDDERIANNDCRLGRPCFKRRLGANLINLSGRYICVQLCATGVPGAPAFITQNGWDMNLLNEAGVPSRAWADWPGDIWVQRFQEGAIYSPDGLMIQFDRGTIWQRDLRLPPPRRHR